MKYTIVDFKFFNKIKKIYKIICHLQKNMLL